MHITSKSSLPNRVLSGLCVLAMTLGSMSGSVWAVEVSDEDYKLLQQIKQKGTDQNLPPHQTPHTAEPPSGGHKNLAEAATNPIANLIQFQVINNYNWENHNSSGYSNATILQPVVPIKLPWEKVPLLITRTTLPYVTTPNFDGPEDRKRGFGDTTLLMLASPKLETKGVQVGLGLNTVIPTAGDNDFTGSGKWQAGPAALYINMQTPKLQWGIFAYQLWDYASTSDGSDRPGVSKLSLQPFITKHFNEGWYVGTPDTPQTYDFKANKWTWALGGQAGKVTKLGKQPVKMFGEVLYNPEDDNGPTAEWTARVGLTFLFPE